MTYKPWITVSLHHHYYDEHTTYANLSPTTETRLLFRNAGLVFRRMTPSTYCILKPTDSVSQEKLNYFFNQTVEFTFELQPLSGDFYFVTEQIEHPEMKIESGKKAGVWKCLSFEANGDCLKKTIDFSITLTAVSKFFEFLLIPKYNPSETTVNIVDTKHNITFKQCDNVAIQGICPTVLRFCSEEKIRLQENYTFKLDLVEIKKSGEIVLKHNLPLPKVSATSIENPQDAISSYIYF